MQFFSVSHSKVKKNGRILKKFAQPCHLTTLDFRNFVCAVQCSAVQCNVVQIGHNVSPKSTDPVHLSSLYSYLQNVNTVLLDSRLGPTLSCLVEDSPVEIMACVDNQIQES